MLVTRALKLNVSNGAFNDIWDAIFTFIDKSEYILYFSKKPHHLVGLLDLAMLCYYKVYYFRTLLAMCFGFPCDVTKTIFC